MMCSVFGANKSARYSRTGDVAATGRSPISIDDFDSPRRLVKDRAPDFLSEPQLFFEVVLKGVNKFLWRPRIEQDVVNELMWLDFNGDTFFRIMRVLPRAKHCRTPLGLVLKSFPFHVKELNCFRHLEVRFQGLCDDTRLSFQVVLAQVTNSTQRTLVSPGLGFGPDGQPELSCAGCYSNSHVVRRIYTPHRVGHPKAAPALCEKRMAVLMQYPLFVWIVPGGGVGEIQFVLFENLDDAAEIHDSIQAASSFARGI